MDPPIRLAGAGSGRELDARRAGDRVSVHRPHTLGLPESAAAEPSRSSGRNQMPPNPRRSRRAPDVVGRRSQRRVAAVLSFQVESKIR